MNKNKFRAVMSEHGDTYKTLAPKLDLAESTLCDKVNEKSGAGFTQSEILAVKNLYHLSAEQIDSIFFTIQVS